MTHFLSRSPLTALLAALVATSAAAQAPLEPAAASRLAAWQQAPDAAGELVYRGTTFALNAPTASAEIEVVRSPGVPVHRVLVLVLLTTALAFVLGRLTA